MPSYVSDNNRCHPTQDDSILGTSAPRAYAPDVPVKTETSGTKELPEEMRKAVRDCLEAVMKERKWNGPRAVETGSAEDPQTRIDRATASNILNLKGSIGIHALLKLRALSGRSIDEILGLKPKGPPPPAVSAKDPIFREAVKGVMDFLQAQEAAQAQPLDVPPPLPPVRRARRP